MIKATYEKPPAAEGDKACPPNPDDIYLGGLVMGYRWPGFFYAADENHEAVGFAGYPLGGIRMMDVLFGPVEKLCKGQTVISG
ncbi:hypothetical protein [Streptomyces shenzhenensis]|uniref:hypothetical protein n=1 Tax=Streptomyces shenzhenensis TaxID=943815 RepID=UPI0015F10040|nr:hypothetical protein [Streptomyces shenzhenensis]